MLKKIKAKLQSMRTKLLSIDDLRPMQDWHTNNVLKGIQKEGVTVIEDLPITQLGDKLVSIWHAKSLWTRIKFLLTGKVNFQIMAPTHAPINISIGEYESNEDEQNGK